MVKVVWSYRATNQLERAVKYIRVEQGLSYAKTVAERILSSTSILESTPQIGQIEPLLEHKKSEYRYLVVWSYKSFTSWKKIVLWSLEYFILPKTQIN